MVSWTEYLCVFFEQLILFMRKILAQKWTNGRETIKEFLIPLVLIAMTMYIFAQSVNFDGYFAANYNLIRLPPLAEVNTNWGIFQGPPGDDDNLEPSLNYVSKERLYFSPASHAGVAELMSAMKTKYPAINLFGEDSSGDVSTQYDENIFTTWAALNFELTDEQISTGSFLTAENNGGVSNVKYTIRMNPQVALIPDFTFDDDVYRDAVASADWYAKSGYLTLQNFVTSYVSGLYPDVPDDFEIDMFIQRYPYSTDQDEAPGIDYEVLRFYLWKWMGSTILTLAIFLPVLMILIQPVKERCSRMKDLLQISGMLDTAYYMAYILSAFLVIMAISTICVILLALGNVLGVHQLGPYFALLACYGLGLIAFSLAFGFVIPRPEFIGLPLYIMQAGLAVGGCYIANDYGISIGLKLFIGTIFPPINFTNGIFAIELYLYHHSGEDMDYNHVDNDKNLPPLNAVLICLLVSTLLYFFVAVGMPFDWLFSDESTAQSIAAMMRDDETEVKDIEDKDGSIEHGLANDVLSVRDLTQVYPDGTKAVKGVTFSVASGEILSFLGANGAGKSTTMNMLCGTLAPSFGDAVINGHSITRDKTMACRNLGICMQQDVIWEDISIRDHLLLFGRLRGLHGQKLQDNVDTMLASLGFPEKQHSLAGTLSGGQKRRLCVGISMVGDNPVVFLDEPTAGLDPVSRRQLWELVQANRHNRAILLTTHFMDEADVLGDRIAIVKEGQVRAVGTSRYLKKKFGVGYLLRSSLAPEVDKNPIVDIIKRHVAGAQVVSDAGTELSLRLPLEAAENFPTMFEELEGPGKDRGVMSFGIETTTLEEVFMNIVNEDLTGTSVQDADKLIGATSVERSDHLKQLMVQDSKRHPVTEADVALMLTPGSTNFDFSAGETWTQTKNMLDKRRAQLFRSKGQRIFGVIFPLVVLCMIGAVMVEIPTEVTDSDPSPTDMTYMEYFVTPIAASSEALAQVYAAAASIDYYTYVGETYNDVYSYVLSETAGGAAAATTNSSGDSIYFESYNNFTVLYNATLPVNFPAVVNDVLVAITRNVTGNLLTFETVNQPFPLSTIGDQLNYGIIVMLMLALAAGSIGGGVSIVLSGERVQLVKHQQLASGASRLAYWTANFITDSLVILLQLFMLVIILAVVSKKDYADEGAGVVLAAGLLWILNLVFRFYIFSFFISEVRAAQTFYFYGSLMSMYILAVVYVIIVQDASSGDANTSLSRTVACIVSALDPTVGFGLVVFYQKNFLGVRSTNGDAGTLDESVGGLLVLTLGLTVIAYFIIFVFMEIGFSGVANAIRDGLSVCCGGSSEDPGSLLGASAGAMQVSKVG
jgi:ATP-binding cassette subfamily A (ABC1) protein 3